MTTLGDGGSGVACSGCQGRKDLSFCMPHCLAQIRCGHRDLGRFRGV
ncbi:hypothetical protein ICNINCKA_00674 [Synechococcus sp. CBW1107]|nr:hypothetical protein ICNINCKA_00674 [Synechococcus sp. CBW1107]